MFDPLLVAASLLASSAVPAPAPAPAAPQVLAALEEAAPPAAPKWTGSVHVGATFTDGNTETMSAAAGFDA
ncbi:MAG: hypothetical protein AB1726_13295, partial [Planctomycetota bacterium]